MTTMQPFWHQTNRKPRAAEATIVQALDMWSSWFCDFSPLGETGDYALDMLLADAFRALLYRPEIKDRLDWIQREVRKPRRRSLDDLYQAEIIAWWLDIFETTKAPGIVNRIQQRRLRCAS